jgi:hypothetical protein
MCDSVSHLLQVENISVNLRRNLIFLPVVSEKPRHLENPPPRHKQPTKTDMAHTITQSIT